ncbi:Efflux ABC transporter permease [Burkholderiales bacterium]|nr:Efflux ABC transporter permease [Burkholderiales bacterium]
MRSLSIALRNLLRNRRRSLTTLLAMIVGALAILLFGGFSQSIKNGLETGFVRTSGHLQIQHRGYYLFGSGNPAAYGIRDYLRIIERVKRDPALGPMLTVVTPILQMGGIGGNFAAERSKTVFATGYIVGEQNLLHEWNDYRFPIKPRRSALTDSGPDAAVIGMGVARILELCAPLDIVDCPLPEDTSTRDGARMPADIAALAGHDQPAAHQGDTRIELLVATAQGLPNVGELHVLKAESLGIKELDDVYVAMHLANAQQLVFGREPHQATAIVLQLRHTGQIPAARAQLQRLLDREFADDKLEIQDFGTLNPTFGQTITFFDTVFTFIALLIGVIVLFTVGNTMSTAVVERTVEIGTLRAMGLRRGGIRSLFVFEGLILGAVGAVMGVLVAIVAAELINHGGVYWTPPGRVDRIPLTLYVWGETRSLVGCALGLILVATVSAWWPARRAARLNIVEALRHV